MNDFDFFRELVKHVSCSLHPAKAWQETFEFLSQFMPIEGICLHHFDRSMETLNVDFVVTSKGYFEPNLAVPLSEENFKHVENHEQNQNAAYYSTTLDPVSCKFINALAMWVPTRERSLLVSILGSKEEVFGHLVLIGSQIKCFTERHHRLFSLMHSPVSLAMINIRKHRRSQELKERLDQERLRLAGEVKLMRKGNLIGENSGLLSTMQLIRQLAGKDTTVLILGETGTGKELIADAVQQISARTKGPYIKINCGAIPPSLIDSELFGYEKGAFTGATSTRAGVFEQADGGTLFLDEIGEMPGQAQVRLLRALQQGTIERVGSNRSIAVNVRIIAATNRSLEEMVASGKFRRDMFFRLNVYPIHLPPLRHRTEDLPLLIRHFIKKIATRYKLTDDIELRDKSMQNLKTYQWPGNVRELENLVERSMTINPKGPLDICSLLPTNTEVAPKLLSDQKALEALIDKRIKNALSESNFSPETTSDEIDNTNVQTDIKPLDEVMANHIRETLSACKGVINGPNGAAEKLGLPPTTLRKRMVKLKIPYGRKHSY